MANRETRKEQYEDALFALLMDEMAQEDGEELLRLNEQLKQDPGAAVPQSVQRRCERVIGTAFSRRQFRAPDSPVARPAPPGGHFGCSSVYGGLCCVGGCAGGHHGYSSGGVRWRDENYV